MTYQHIPLRARPTPRIAPPLGAGERSLATRAALPLTVILVTAVLLITFLALPRL